MSHSDKIELFKEETIKFNRKHNLISRKNTEKIIDEAIEEATALTTVSYTHLTLPTIYSV